MNDISILGVRNPEVDQDIMKGSEVSVSSQPRGLAETALTENHIAENVIQHNGIESPPVKEATALERNEGDRDTLKPSYHSENGYDYKYHNTEHSNSSDIESDLDQEELSPRSPQAGEYQDRRSIDITQRLPSSLGQFSSPFSAEEARLRYSLESSQLKERFHHLNPSFGEEARRRFSLPSDSKQLDISLPSNHSSPPNSPDSNALSKSPYTPYKGQGHGTPRSLDRSFDDQDSYALTANVREGLYFCHLCNFSGTTQKEFDQHMTVHFEHVCPHCDYKSRTEGRLKRHIKDFHTEDSDGFGTRTMPGRPKVFRCKQCEYSTTDKIEFWTHSRTHIKEDKLLQCPRCPFVTEYKHHLEYHLRNHFGSKPFKCPKCNYACVNKSMLNSHMKSHTNVYQYRCADCTYATKYCHSLKLHLRKYNHKPAAVLNSDGSLPQGVDATASGLSLLAKRGPPRGPRGPRKDKLDGMPSPFPQMPTSLPGPMPGIPGMMSPFWPMLHGLPNGLHSPLGMGPRFNTHMPGLPGFGMKSEEMTSPLGGANSFKCNFCSFVAGNRDVLTSHVMKVHAGENQDLFSIFGISSESILEDKNRFNALNALKSPVKSSRMNMFSAGLETPPHIKRESIDDMQIANKGNSGLDLTRDRPVFPYMDGKFSGEGSHKDVGVDILKQMTLKFGSGPVERDNKRRHTTDCPLDLTKPRYSPPYSYSLPTSSGLDRKPEEDDQSSGENSINSGDVTSPPPRKRSRKGKAFKLDTLCMKLQEQKSQAYGSEEDSSQENEEMYTSDLLPVEADGHSPCIDVDRDSEDDVEKDKMAMDMQKRECDDKTGDMEVQESEHIKTEMADETLKEIHSSLAILNNKTNDDEKKESTEMDKDIEVVREEPTSSLSEDGNEQVKEMSQLPSHNRRKSVPLAIQRGADIAWKILNNNSDLSDPDQVKKNGSNGHGMELYPFDRKLLISASDCMNGLTKGEYECPHCQIAFGDCIMYTMHMGYHGYKDPYKCNMCGDTCKDRVEFFLHIARAAHN